MKIKLDENMPAGLVTFLSSLAHDADGVIEEGLAGMPDAPVWDAVQQAERFFITQDLDFSDLRQLAPGAHYGILLIRLQQPTRRELDQCIRTIFQTEKVEEWSG